MLFKYPWQEEDKSFLLTSNELQLAISSDTHMLVTWQLRSFFFPSNCVQMNIQSPDLAMRIIFNTTMNTLIIERITTKFETFKGEWPGLITTFRANNTWRYLGHI